MQKLILISAVSILILAQIRAAQSGISGKEDTNREAVRNKRHIEQLIKERDQLKMFLAEYERIRDLPDIEKKHNEYLSFHRFEIIYFPESPNSPPEKIGAQKRNCHQG